MKKLILTASLAILLPISSFAVANSSDWMIGEQKQAMQPSSSSEPVQQRMTQQQGKVNGQQLKGNAGQHHKRAYHQGNMYKHQQRQANHQANMNGFYQQKQANHQRDMQKFQQQKQACNQGYMIQGSRQSKQFDHQRDTQGFQHQKQVKHQGYMMQGSRQNRPAGHQANMERFHQQKQIHQGYMSKQFPAHMKGYQQVHQNRLLN